LNKNYKTIFIFNIFICFNLDLYAITLQSSLNEMIKTNPLIITKQKELEAARYDLKAVKSAYYPKVDVQASYGYEQTKSQLTAYEKRNWDTWNTSATVTQNLFAGFATEYDVKTKEFKVKAREHALIEQANDSALLLAKSYLDILRAYELLLVETDNVKTHEKIFKDIKARTEGGSGRISDFMEATAKLSLAYSNLLAQENNYNDTLASFHKAIGRYEEGKNLIRPNVVQGFPVKLEDALSQALKANPSLLVSRYEIEAAKSAMRLERHSYMPKLDASLNAKTSENTSGLGGKNDSASGLLTLSWNIYNGGSDYARVDRAVTEIEMSIEKLHTLQREVMEGMGLAFNAYISLEKQKEFLLIYEESNVQKKGFYQEEFDLGRRSLIDLLNTEDEYNTARRKVIQNYYDSLYSQYRILDAQGKLLSHFGVKVENNQKIHYNFEADEVEREHPIVICQNTADRSFGINGCQVVPKSQEYTFLDTKNKLILDQNDSKSSTKTKEIQKDTLNLDSVIESNNFAKAFEWYSLAAGQGDKKSMKALSNMYKSGIGIEMDLNKSNYWNNQIKPSSVIASEYNSTYQSTYTQKYQEAIDFIENNNSNDLKLKGYHLLVEGARLGDPQSQFMLARMYNQGLGIPVEKEKAFYWYREAARNEYSPAYLIVWAFYRDGKYGVTKDISQAEYWRKKAIDARSSGKILAVNTQHVNTDQSKSEYACDYECAAQLAKAKTFDGEGKFDEAEKEYKLLSSEGNGEASRLIAEHYFSIANLDGEKIKKAPLKKNNTLKKPTVNTLTPKKESKEYEGIKSLDERLRDLGISLTQESKFLGGTTLLKDPPPLQYKINTVIPRN